MISAGVACCLWLPETWMRCREIPLVQTYTDLLPCLNPKLYLSYRMIFAHTHLPHTSFCFLSLDILRLALSSRFKAWGTRSLLGLFFLLLYIPFVIEGSRTRHSLSGIKVFGYNGVTRRYTVLMNSVRDLLRMEVSFPSDCCYCRLFE